MSIKKQGRPPSDLYFLLSHSPLALQSEHQLQLPFPSNHISCGLGKLTPPNLVPQPGQVSQPLFEAGNSCSTTTTPARKPDTLLGDLLSVPLDPIQSHSTVATSHQL